MRDVVVARTQVKKNKRKATYQSDSSITFLLAPFLIDSIVFLTSFLVSYLTHIYVETFT